METQYFITYPRCDLQKEIVLISIKQFPFPVPHIYIRVCQEQHSDGGNHLHCLLQFSGKFHCSNNRFFDIVHDNRTYHPNIQSARSSVDVANYISKGGDFIEEGICQNDGRKRQRNSSDNDEHYRRALEASSKEEALQIIKENDPRTFVLQYHNINANLERLFAPTYEQYQYQYVSPFDPKSFTVPQELVLWANENLGPNRPHRPKSLILEGPTRIGKTEWARSLGPHNYIMGFMDFNSKSFSNDVWYNVIDNVAPSYLMEKHWKQLIGSKHDWQSNVKYEKPVQIKGGIPSIVLCNPGSSESSYKAFLGMEENRGLKEWTMVNAEFFFVDTALYNLTDYCV